MCILHTVLALMRGYFKPMGMTVAPKKCDILSLMLHLDQLIKLQNTKQWTTTKAKTKTRQTVSDS